MNDMIASPALPGPLGPQPYHTLGPVADDWAAIDVWLGIIAANSKSRTGQTVATYRYHLAKLRWYCEHELGRPPSTWDVQDVFAFREFLANVPPSALQGAFNTEGEPIHTPFQKQPGASSQTDILRFVKAMFSGLHAAGYIRLNPMKSIRVDKERRFDAKRSVPSDFLDLVLKLIDDEPRSTPKQHQLLMRDRFVFVCLRETGLRASELIGAKMDAFDTVYVAKGKRKYWVLKVAASTAKGGKERTIPVTPVLLDALKLYREAFGLKPYPGKDTTNNGLILSVRTQKKQTGSTVKTASDRRFFGAWRSVGTRQALHGIVKGRVQAAVEFLKQSGDPNGAAHLERVSAHWLRHTFAITQIMGGQDMRTVATSLGHKSLDTTMGYTEQDAIEQIEKWEAENPGSVAVARDSGDAIEAAWGLN